MNAREKAEDVLIRLQRNSVEARQLGIIRKAIEVAEEEATKKERARCIELIKRCRVMYERMTNEERDKMREALAKDPSAKPLPLSPFYLNSAEQTYSDRAMGCEYAEMVVREVDLGSNMMPMAF